MNSSWIELSSRPLSNQEVHSLWSLPKGGCVPYSVPCKWAC